MGKNTFTNTTGGDWNTGGNWSTGFIPDSNAQVSFVSGTHTSVVNGGPWTIQSLNVNVATVTLQIDVNLTTQTLDGNLGTIAVQSGATFTAGSLNSNSGTITVSDNGVFTVQNLNGNSGIIVAASNGLVNLLGNSAGNFAVSGGLLKIAGNINGSGSIEMNTGTIWVAGQLGNSSYNLDDGGVDQAYFDSLQSTTNNAFSGADQGDRLAIKGVTINSAIYVGTTLTLDTSGGPFTFTDITLAPGVEPIGAKGTTTFEGSSYGYIELGLACFAEGTCIDTTDGPLPVEALRAGILVLTAAGAARPVHWIGWRRVEPHRDPDPTLRQPIRILADAFASGMPRRDLRVSPDHAILVKGVLVPARLLANGATIFREDGCRSVTYYHIELDSHDVLLAEGLPAESYLDTGNRCMFENAGQVSASHPASNGQARREAWSCATLVTDSHRVQPLWQELAQRAEQLGYPLSATPATDDPAVALMVGDQMVKPVNKQAGRCSFVLAWTGGAVRLLSHAAAPSELEPWTEDRRQLGIMVRRLTLRRDNEQTAIPLDHPAIGRGWWPVERGGGEIWRWTNGAADLALEPGGPALLDVEFGAMPAYPLHGELLGDNPL